MSYGNHLSRTRGLDIQCFLQGYDVPLPRNVFFDNSFFRVDVLGSSVKRLGTPVSKRYPAWDGECFLSGASRNAGLAPFALTMLRLKIVSGSVFTQAEKPSRWTRSLPRRQIRSPRQGTARIIAYERCQTVLDG